AVAKSMDDRIGCVVQIETLRQLGKTPHEIHFVFTVQEEVGIRGARTSAHRVEPDIAIALDVTDSGDLPETKNFPVYLGKGPAIKVMDLGMIVHPRLKERMIEAAEKNNIPYQLEVLTFGTTDAAAMQIARGGAAAGALSIPCRHVHTPSEMVDIDDVENAVKLLLAMLAGPLDLGAP
ncbi:MAG: M20/M25/M40 family metallo-hydrolase, partial [Anaerolineae bacterium]